MICFLMAVVARGPEFHRPDPSDLYMSNGQGKPLLSLGVISLGILGIPGIIVLLSSPLSVGRLPMVWLHIYWC